MRHSDSLQIQYTPMRNVGELRTFNPKLKDSAGGEVNDQSNVHAKGRGQRSKVKGTEVTTQLNRFRTVTPVWIHQWLRNDAQSIEEVPYCFSRSFVKFQGHMAKKNRRFSPKLGFLGL